MEIRSSVEVLAAISADFTFNVFKLLVRCYLRNERKKLLGFRKSSDSFEEIFLVQKSLNDIEHWRDTKRMKVSQHC